MKITLEQREIQAALEAYVQDQIPMVQGMDFAVELSGTTAKGFEAALTVAAKADAVDVAPTKPIKRKTAPVAVVAASKLVGAETEETAAADITNNPEDRGEAEPETLDETSVEVQAEETPTPQVKKGGPVFQFAKKG
jgi:hypothetical protein